MRTNILSIIALALTLLLGSCQKDDYTNVIPADAAAVVSIDFAKLAEQGELDNINAEELKKIVPVDFAMMMIGKEVSSFLVNPEKMGIDFRSPVILFAIDGRKYGATMKLYDEDKTEEFFTALANRKLCTAPTSKDGRKGGTMLGSIEYSFNGNSLVLLACENSTATAKAMKQLLEQDSEHSFASTAAFDKMSSANGVAKMYVSPRNLHLILPFDQLGEIEMLSTLNFTNGRASIKTDVWGKTEKAQKTIDEAYANMRRLTGEFDDDMPSDFVVWASAGMNGEWLLSKLKENKQAKEFLFMLERAIDIEQMLRAVDGDVTFVATPSAISYSRFVPATIRGNVDWAVMAEVKTNDFMNDVPYWMQSMHEYGISMNSAGERRYSFDINGDRLYWGVDDDGDELFLASDGGFNRMWSSKDNETLDAYEDDIERSYIYAYLNLQTPWLKRSIGLKEEAFQQLAKTFKCVIIKSQKAGEFELEVEMNNKQENFMKQFISTFKFQH